MSLFTASLRTNWHLPHNVDANERSPNQSEYATCGALKVAFIVVIANNSQAGEPGCNKVGFEEQVLISIMTGHAPICSAHHICNKNARNQQQVAIVLLKDPSKTIRTQSVFSQVQPSRKFIAFDSSSIFPELFKSTESTSTPLIFSYQ